MADIDPTPFDASSSSSVEDHFESGVSLKQNTEGASSEPTPSQRGEDTPIHGSLQAEEDQEGQKHDALSRKASPNATLSAIQRLSNTAREACEVEFDRNKIQPGQDADVPPAITAFSQELAELLRWKESLRLMSLDTHVPAPYYTGWTKEANLFFRRLVILKRRLENIRKSQGA